MNKTPLWKIGLIFFVASVVVNSIFVNVGVGGILRELARLSVITGLILLIVGLIKKKSKQ